MAASKDIQDIVVTITTSGASEQTANMIVNGAAAAASLAVAAGTTLVISDIIVGGLGAAVWQLQQSNDSGSTWFNIAQINGLVNTGANSTGSPIYSYNPGLTVTGSSTTSIRMRVTTAGGAVAVIATLRSYLESGA